MSFLINLGYQFALPGNRDTKVDGGMVLAYGLAEHELFKRDFEQEKYSHLNYCLFDPQLYMAGLNAASTSGNTVAKLSTYDWFGIEKKEDFSSSAEWYEHAQDNIQRYWKGTAPNSNEWINRGVKAAIDIQVKKGFDAIILPSPLTRDMASDYSEELKWVDAGLQYYNSLDLEIPLYASVAIRDKCLAYSASGSNNLIDIIADSLSAREIDGIYLVLEQGDENDELRQITNPVVLEGLLKFTDIIKSDTDLNLISNFIGFYGLALCGLGADGWCSGAYKSLRKFSLSVNIGRGRAYPLYWSFKVASDINCDEDLDTLVEKGFADVVLEETNEAALLNQALRSGRKVDSVGSWTYSQSNVYAARGHYIQSAYKRHRELMALSEDGKMKYIKEWLQDAVSNSQEVERTLDQHVGSNYKSNLQHVLSWRNAFESYNGSQ